MNNQIGNDNFNSNNFFISNPNMRNIENNQISATKSSTMPIMTTSVNKLKDQSVNINNSLGNNINNNGNSQGNYTINTKEQPKPWLID